MKTPAWAIAALALALALLLTGCASAPMSADARGPNGERLPDLCHQSTVSGTMKAQCELVAAMQSRDFPRVRSIASEMIALAREREGPDSLAEAQGLRYLGSAALQQHDLIAAEHAADQALKICTEHAESGRLAVSEGPFCVEVAELLATSLFGQGRFDRSSEIRRVLLSYYEDMQGPERWRLLGGLVQLATDLLLAGHPDDANTYLGRAVGEWHQLRNGILPIRQDLLQSFGASLIRFGDVAEAHDVLEHAVQADDTSGTPEDTDKGRRLILLGRVLLERGDVGKASDRFTRGAVVLEQSLGQNHPEAISAWFYVGKALLLSGDSTTARTVFLNVVQAVLALPESVMASMNAYGAVPGADLVFSLASAAEAVGDKAAARGALRALADGTKDDVWLGRPLPYFDANMARDLLALTDFLLSEREFARAERFADLVRREVETRLGPEHPALPRALVSLGISRARQGDEAGGLRLLAQSVDLADRIFDRQLSGLSGRQRLEVLKSSTDLDLALNLPPEVLDARTAYRVTVGRKNIALRLAIEERSLHNTSPRIAALYQDYNATRRQLARLARAPVANEEPTRDARQALVERAETLERELSHSSDEFRRVRLAARADFSSVCAALGPQAGLIEYVLYRSHRDNGPAYLAFLVRGDQCNREPLRFELGAAEPLSKEAQGLRVALKAGLRGIAPTPPVSERARRVAELILPGELRNRLDGLAVLVIAPDGELDTIPFGILPGDVGHDFLIETRSIFYVPSGPDLLRNERAFATKHGGLSLF